MNNAVYILICDSDFSNSDGRVIPKKYYTSGETLNWGLNKGIKLKSEQRFLWSVMWVDKYNCSGPVVVKHVVEVT